MGIHLTYLLVIIITGIFTHNITKNRYKIVEIDHLKVGEFAWIIYKEKISKVVIQNWRIISNANGLSIDYTVRYPDWEDGCGGIDRNNTNCFKSKEELIDFLKASG